MYLKPHEQLHTHRNLLEFRHLEPFPRWLVVGIRHAIPGHGEVSDQFGVRRFRHYFSEIRDAARVAHEKGQSKEDFVKTIDLPEFHAFQGYPERFKENAAQMYDEVK